MKIFRKKTLATVLLSTTLLGFTTMSTSDLDQMIANAATITAKSNQDGNVPAKPSGSGNSSASSAKLSGSKTISKKKTLSYTKASSKKDNQSAIYVKKGGNLTTNKVTVNKTGNTTSEDNSNFYGQNAGILTTKNGKTTLNNLTETTNANGANGVFSTGSNATVKINKANINTYKNSSRGLDATQKGTIIANDTNITTRGSHSATLANDRGGGTVKLTKGTLKTAGDGSPIVYSTGNISIDNVTGNATGAEAAVIEGANSISSTDSNLTGNKNNGVMLYQSMSGDAEEGTANFSMNGGSLTSNAKDGSKGTTNNTGALFYVTNTKANISLNNVKLNNASDTLIRLASDRWGTSGKNGGDLTFTATGQTLNGNVLVDKNSSLNLKLTNNTTLNGSINSDNTSGTSNLTLDSTSKWNVTKTSYLSAFNGSQSSINNISSNGHNVYYDKSNSANSWLNGKTYTLSGGGQLIAK